MLKFDYTRYQAETALSRAELAAMDLQARAFAYRPLVSLLMVVSDADETWIKSSIESVLRQIYPRLELCVCDNASERPHVAPTLEEYASLEGAVKLRRLPEKRSLAGAYAEALSLATGELVMLLDQGDELAPEALFAVVEFLQDVRADVVYTDEDRIDVAGERATPVFKAYWSPDLLLASPYAGRMCVMRRDVLEAAGGFREGADGSEDGSEEHDLLLRLSERTDRVHHLPGVLYHRGELTPGEDPSEGGRRAPSPRPAEEALARRGEEAIVRPTSTGRLRVTRPTPGQPKVSVVLSVQSGVPDAAFVEDLERKASHPMHELIVAGGEPGSRGAETVGHPSPARAMNLAAEKADGEYLVFTRGCTAVATEGWLPELLGHARRPGTGAVGCKLLKPDGGLGHGGTWIDLGRLEGRAPGAAFGDGDSPRVVDRTFNPEAASAGCMMVRAETFEAAGGFDDENLPTAFYDLDLSFRLREGGLRNVYTPYASLVLGEPEDETPGESEVAYMWRRWWGELVRLLYYRRSPVPRTTHRGLDERSVRAVSLQLSAFS